jgi:hypothetical protein
VDNVFLEDFDYGLEREDTVSLDSSSKFSGDSFTFFFGSSGELGDDILHFLGFNIGRDVGDDSHLLGFNILSVVLGSGSSWHFKLENGLRTKRKKMEVPPMAFVTKKFFD